MQTHTVNTKETKLLTTTIITDSKIETAS